jgi:hypothetical protein
MSKWDYAVTRLMGNDDDKLSLDNWGNEGWELVAVTQIGAVTFAYLKREKQIKSSSMNL